MKFAYAAVAGMVAGSAFFAANASAQESSAPGCREMHLLQAIEDITYVDTGAEGPDAGDRRILRWTVTNLDGRRIGTFYVVTTVLEIAETGDIARADGHVVFANGDLKVSVINTIADAANTNRSNEAPIEWAIEGGTGAFAGATGVLVNGPAGEPEDLSNWTLDIYVRCL